MMIFIDKNRPWPDRKKQFNYSGILFPELFKKFFYSTHESYYSFEKGKNILYFPEKERSFFYNSIKEIKKEADFLKRNIVSVERRNRTLFFIDDTNINFLFDKKWSENLWVHRSDYDLINKMLASDFDFGYWKINMENRVFYKNLGKKPIRFYLINRQDKVVLNNFVSADIIDEIGIKFCFGINKAISISEKNFPKLKEKIKEKNLEIMLSNQNMFTIFQE